MTKSKSGENCILYARGVSDDSKNSIVRQLGQMREYAQRHEMSVVDEVVVEASSMSRPTASALDDLRKRKVNRDDFAVIIAADLSRFSRGGFMHMMSLLVGFENLGVAIVTLDLGRVNTSLFNTINTCALVGDTKRVPRHGKTNFTHDPCGVPGDDGRRDDSVQVGPADLDRRVRGQGVGTEEAS